MDNETNLLTVQDQERLFPELTKLLDEANRLAATMESYGATPEAPEGLLEEALKTVMRNHHYWPALQLKWFNDHSGRVLLHNTYKRMDVTAFQALYDECRSVVLDVSSGRAHVVVSLANPIPERRTVQQYKYETDTREGGWGERWEESFEGTVVSVYHHKGAWRFGTTSCPTVDRSRYFHRTKTHGEMVDEAIGALFGEGMDAAEIAALDESQPATARERARLRSHALREKFGALLDPARSYAFILVHHENKHFVDYTERWGEGYAKLVHITTRERATLTDVPLTDAPLAEHGVVYARRFASPMEALDWLDAEGGNCFGFMVWLEGGKRMLKVASERLQEKEEHDLGNPNPWMNMLHVYVQNKPHYQVKDYIAEYKPEVENEPSPVYVIHTVMLTMRDILYDLFRRTTRYHVDSKRYARLRGPMGDFMDTTLPPCVYFHLKELRHIQITTHSHAFLTPRAVYHYLFHQTLKNLRMLVDFLATNPFAPMHPKASSCFAILAAGLRG